MKLDVLLPRLCVLVMVVVLAKLAGAEDDRSGQNLTAVPSDLQNTETIRLNNNKITDVGVGLFPPLTKVLYLSGNHLTHISADAFCNTQLGGIYLDYNFLNSVPNFTCVSDTLKILRIIGNRLVGHLESNVLRTYWSLKIVNLQKNNVTSFDKDLFCSFPLNTLDAGENLLRKFLYLSCASETLVRLELNSNRICSIKASDFANFTVLRSLNLAGNCLSSVDILLSAQNLWTSLEKLYVSYLSLEHVSFTGKGFQKLNHLILQGNPLGCFQMVSKQN